MCRQISTYVTSLFGGIAFLAASGVVNGSVVTLAPLNPVYVVGEDPITIDIVGQDFTAGSVTASGGTNLASNDGTSGGPFQLSWDPALLTLTGVTLTFPYAVFPGSFDDSTPGLLTGDVFDFGGFPSPPGGTSLANFDIAQLTFTFVGPTGTSAADLTLGNSGNAWAEYDGAADMDPVFIGGSISIQAVPVPPAVLLMASGLMGLIGVARRRKSAAACSPV